MSLIMGYFILRAYIATISGALMRIRIWKFTDPTIGVDGER